MKSQPKIYVAGHQGMVGSAIIRELERQGYSNLICRTHQELDLTNQQAVQNFFSKERPEQVYLAAARVGGIHANNTYPAQFIYDNIMIQSNIIHQSFLSGVKNLLFLGSSCIYPKLASQPICENALLTGKLEPTNEPYAIAKIAGIKMCESYNRQYGKLYGLDYRSVMPTNLYGPKDNYEVDNGHVIPALIRKFHEAKIKRLPHVVVWGTGLQRREFLYVDDMAKACIFLLNLNKKQYDQATGQNQNYLNIGVGTDITILDLANLLASIIDYKGQIIFDITKPDGTPRKLLNSRKLLDLGWAPLVTLEDGLRTAYQSFLQDFNDLNNI